MPLLFKHFLGDRQPVEPVSEHELAQMAWLGNVRELRNFVERACAIGARDALEMRPAATEAAAEAGASAVAFEQPFKEFRERWIDHGEREYLRRLLERHARNVVGGRGRRRAGSHVRVPVDSQARAVTRGSSTMKSSSLVWVAVAWVAAAAATTGCSESSNERRTVEVINWWSAPGEIDAMQPAGHAVQRPVSDAEGGQQEDPGPRDGART